MPPAPRRVRPDAAPGAPLLALLATAVMTALMGLAAVDPRGLSERVLARVPARASDQNLVRSGGVPPGVVGVRIETGLIGGGPSAAERARMARQQAAADSVLARLAARARMRADSVRLAREDSARADSSRQARARP